MTITNSTNGSLDPALLQLLQQKSQTGEQTSALLPPKRPLNAPSKDTVSLSGQEPQNQSSSFLNQQNRGTQLINEEVQELGNGFRRTQEFETGNGKKFTRIEEVTIENDRSKRLIIQQNESGSTTTFENIIDQQDDGTLRSVQRFTDETGATQANVQLNYTPTPNDALIGGAPLSTTQNSNSPRGGQIDLSV